VGRPGGSTGRRPFACASCGRVYGPSRPMDYRDGSATPETSLSALAKEQGFAPIVAAHMEKGGCMKKGNRKPVRRKRTNAEKKVIRKQGAVRALLSLPPDPVGEMIRQYGTGWRSAASLSDDASYLHDLILEQALSEADPDDPRLQPVPIADIKEEARCSDEQSAAMSKDDPFYFPPFTMPVADMLAELEAAGVIVTDSDAQTVRVNPPPSP